MQLHYSSLKDEDLFIMTDFSCTPSKEILNQEGLFKMIWCQTGDATFIIDNYEVTLQKDEVLFCTPLNVIQIGQLDANVVSLVFNKEFFCIQTHDDQVSCQGFLFFGSSEPQRILLPAAEQRNFGSILAMIKEDMQINDPLQGEMLRSLLKRLLIKSTRLAATSLPEPTIPNAQLNVIREYNMLVEKHFRELHNVKDYAALLFKSPKTLSNLFPKYSDKSPLMVINDRILLEAKRLLVYSDKTTADIAIELGYKDPGHFSKFFKKHIGLTPTLFRKNKLT
jgi:AraC-like DNA-binding protein